MPSCLLARTVFSSADPEAPPVKLIPTPRHLSSDCGSAVRVAGSDGSEAERLLREAGVAIDRIEPLDE